jgi:hypothetical protein
MPLAGTLRAVTVRANARTGAHIVKELQAGGARSLRAIAAGLNQRGVEIGCRTIGEHADQGLPKSRGHCSAVHGMF